MKFLKCFTLALFTLVAPLHAKHHKKNSHKNTNALDSQASAKTAPQKTTTAATDAQKKKHSHNRTHKHQHPLCRQDSEFSNLYYHNGTTFHDIREPKQTCFFTFHTNTLFNTRYFNLLSIGSIVKKRGIVATSKTLVTLGKLKYEKRMLKKDVTQPEGFIWDALLDRYENNTAEQKAMIDDIRLITSHISSINNPMAELLYNLHIAGHQNTMISNIGKLSLNLAIAHLKETPDSLPKQEVMSYFTRVMTSKNSSIPSQQNNWISPVIDTCLTKLLHKNKTKKTKIYIAHDKKEVLAALEAGYDIGVVFKNQNNLMNILTALNVPLPVDMQTKIQ